MDSYFLVKGDISGIQDFIYNVQSKGAAKSLKARSFFIQAVGWLAEERIKQVLAVSETIYNGGGNFYLVLKNLDENKFKEMQKEMASALPALDIAICLSYIECDESREFSEWINLINQKSGNEKLSKFQNSDFELIFSPFQDIDKNKKRDRDELLNTWQYYFKKFSESYVRSRSWSIESSVSEMKFPLTENTISLFGHTLCLHQAETADSRYKIRQHVPLWTRSLLKDYREILKEKEKLDPKFTYPSEGEIIELELLADFAKLRTGTDKLGVLKMDIDNLGACFRAVKSKTDSQKLSGYFIDFFTNEFDKILGTNRFKENIYIVFAGGDDCFLMGGWDKIIELSILLRKQFTDCVAQQIKKDISSIKGEITISAAILVLDAHFPIIKMADIAEERLHKAKTFCLNNEQQDASGKPMKNKVSFMGHFFTWEEFDELKSIKEKLTEMIKVHGESRAFLYRIINSFANEDTYVWQQMENPKPFDPALLWRFKYHFRDIRNKEYFSKYFYNYFFNKENGLYSKYIFNAFSEGREFSQILPVAARWTEFSTKAKHKNGS